MLFLVYLEKFKNYVRLDKVQPCYLDLIQIIKYAIKIHLKMKSEFFNKY